MRTNLHDLEALARKVKAEHDGDAAKLAKHVLTLLDENAARYGTGHVAESPSPFDGGGK